jgi:DNA transformation protein
MNRRIPDLRNLGPATEKMLADTGGCRQLRIRFGRDVTLNALYAMEAALRECDWRHLVPDTKARLCREASGS